MANKNEGNIISDFIDSQSVELIGPPGNLKPSLKAEKRIEFQADVDNLNWRWKGRDRRKCGGEIPQRLWLLRNKGKMALSSSLLMAIIFCCELSSIF